MLFRFGQVNNGLMVSGSDKRNRGGKSAGTARKRRGFRPEVQDCEKRLLLTQYYVTNPTDGGPGSLRDMINQAETLTPGDNTLVVAPGLVTQLVGDTLQIPAGNNITIQPQDPNAGTWEIYGSNSLCFNVSGGASLTIIGAQMQGVYGGVAVSNGGSFTATRDTFANDTDTPVWVNPNATCTLTSCNFSGNNSWGLDPYIGAVHDFGTLYASGCTFTSNGGPGLDSGGSTTLVSCNFSGNNTLGAVSTNLPPTGQVVSTSFLGLSMTSTTVNHGHACGVVLSYGGAPDNLKNCNILNNPVGVAAYNQMGVTVGKPLTVIESGGYISGNDLGFLAYNPDPSNAMSVALSNVNIANSGNHGLEAPGSLGSEAHAVQAVGASLSVSGCHITGNRGLGSGNNSDLTGAALAFQSISAANGLTISGTGVNNTSTEPDALGLQLVPGAAVTIAGSAFTGAGSVGILDLGGGGNISLNNSQVLSNGFAGVLQQAEASYNTWTVGGCTFDGNFGYNDWEVLGTGAPLVVDQGNNTFGMSQAQGAALGFTALSDLFGVHKITQL